MDEDMDDKMEEEETSATSMTHAFHDDRPTAENTGTTGRRKMKGVQFRRSDLMEEVKRISRISTRTLEEVVSYWGTSDEHRLRKEELRVAAREMQANRRMSDNIEFTTLGLADKVGEGKALKKAHRTKSREAVLDEQELQYLEGIVDDELIAEVYQSVTSGAQKEARRKAEKLHEEIEKF